MKKPSSPPGIARTRGALCMMVLPGFRKNRHLQAKETWREVCICETTCWNLLVRNFRHHFHQLSRPKEPTRMVDSTTSFIQTGSKSFEEVTFAIQKSNLSTFFLSPRTTWNTTADKVSDITKMISAVDFLVTLSEIPHTE